MKLEPPKLCEIIENSKNSMITFDNMKTCSIFSDLLLTAEQKQQMLVHQDYNPIDVFVLQQFENVLFDPINSDIKSDVKQNIISYSKSTDGTGTTITGYLFEIENPEKFDIAMLTKSMLPKKLNKCVIKFTGMLQSFVRVTTVDGNNIIVGVYQRVEPFAGINAHTNVDLAIKPQVELSSDLIPVPAPAPIHVPVSVPIPIPDLVTEYFGISNNLLKYTKNV